MKKVLVIRHSKSRHDIPGLTDHQRPLNDRGFEDRETIGAFLRDQLKETIDVVYCSDSTRTRQTFDGIKSFVAYESVSYESVLYHISQESLQEFINSMVDEEADFIAIIAHNPGITSFYNTYAERWTSNIPTSGTFLIEAEVDSWGEFRPGIGKISFVTNPKAL